MGKIKSEILNLDIIVNGNKARKEMLDLKETIEAGKKKADELNAALKGEKKGSDKYKEIKKALDETNASVTAAEKKFAELEKQIPLTGKTIAELRRDISITRDALAKAVPGTENWKRLNAQLQEQRTRLRQLTTQAEATDRSMCGLVKTVRDYSLALQGTIAALSKGYQYIEQASEAYEEYDEAVSDAMKTTNLTKEEIISISDELAKMDTRTAQNDLLGLVRVGGKLGISGREDLLGFARAADQINVALGEDLGDNVEEVLGSVGKLVDIFQLKEDYGMEQAMLKIGSAINSLGMASTANEGYIVNFSSQLAGIAPNVNIATSDILGMAAVMDKYNQRAETASTVIQQVIQKMYSDTETFARIAGKSLGEFNDMLAVDTNAAFLSVLEGMNRYQGGLAEIANNLDDMNLRGSRASGILGTLVANLDEVKRQQEIAAQSFEDGSSVTVEALTKNTNAAALEEKALKARTAETVKLGKELQPLKIAAINSSTALLKLVGLLIEYRAALATLVAGLTIAVKWKTTYAKITATLTALRKADTIAIKEGIVAAKAATAASNLLSAAKYALVGNLKLATVHMRAFNAALKANPIGVAITIVTALATAFFALRKRTKEQKEAQEQLTEAQKRTNESMTKAKTKIDEETRALDKLKTALKNTKQGSKERAGLIKEINERYGEYLPNLVSEKDSLNDIFEALKSVNDEFERKIYLEAMDQDLTSITEDVLAKTKTTIDELVKIWNNNGLEMSAETLAALTDAVTEYKAALESGADATAAYNKVMGIVNTAGSQKAAAIRQAGREAAERNYQAQGKVDYDVPGYDPDDYSGANATWQSADDIYRAANFEGFANKAATDMRTAGEAAMNAYQEGLQGSIDDRNFIQALYTSLIPNTPITGGTSGGNGGGDKDWSLSKDEEHQKAVLDLKKKFLSKEIKTKEELDKKILEQEITTLKKRIALNVDTGEDMIKLQNELADKEMQLLESTSKKKDSWSLSKDEEHQKAVLDLKKKFLSKEIKTKEELDKKILEQEITTLKKRIALNVDTEEDMIKLQNELADRQQRLQSQSSKNVLQIINKALDEEEQTYLRARANKEDAQAAELRAFTGSAKKLRQMKRRHAKELAEIDLEHLKEVEAQLRKLLSNDINAFKDINIAGEILSDAEYNALRQRLQEIIKLMNQAAAGKPVGGGQQPASGGSSAASSGGDVHSLKTGMGGGDLFGVSQDQWNQFFQNLEQGKFGAEGLGTAMQAIGGMAQKAMDIAYMAIDRVNAKEKADLKQYEKDNEEKKKSLEKRLNAGLISEAQYNEEVEAMDKEYEAFAEELAVKQAKREKAMNLTQAIINTALGVTMTLAQWGVPWGLIPAGIMAAMGAAEIALIASTPITTGAEEGGEIFTKRKQDGKTFKARLSPDSRGFISSPTVLVGENGTEYVIPDEGVNNPTLRPFLYTLETARRNGTLRNIDFSSVYPAPMPGRAGGGPIGSDPLPGYAPSGSISYTTDPQLVALLTEIRNKLDDPVPAIVSMLGPKGFIEQMKRYEQNQKNKKLNG